MPGWGWALLALVAVAILLFAAVKGLQRLWWGMRHSAVGLAADVIRAAVGQEGELPPEPRSLQNGDSIYGPQIQRDFTGFNIARAKELAEGAVRRACPGGTVRKTVISGYDRRAERRVITFQCGVKDGQKERKFEVDYCYQAPGFGQGETPEVCPRCGGPIPAVHGGNCQFCGARLDSAMEGSWEWAPCREV
ncbi:hypothetical protein [Bittarella massiliensis (ex Durand et al. 2017)]|uniref:hypothetical protein n=1 Tax=Bittarella massiliensis (ex Durand et al. 2017) TaxID=1720313 RepID=UPI001AA11CBB|nr:hypothetical protein [Bittarella massiliensis (ex Durand et al. 2017)]MBO1679092.1 hypothetical protein [Bittarella massiliensis (ex Durand et al. 2017)]